MESSNEINYSLLDPKNPSLHQLIEFTRVHWYRFADLNLTVITKYDKTTRETWSKGRYYLYGQLQVLPDTPITRQLLSDANELNIQRSNSYDEPYSSVEAASIRESEQLYHQLIEIIDRYRIVYEDVMYNPVDGIEYLRAKSNFNNRNKIYK